VPPLTPNLTHLKAVSRKGAHLSSLLAHKGMDSEKAEEESELQCGRVDGSAEMMV
jgi:hypothetical protein